MKIIRIILFSLCVFCSSFSKARGGEPDSNLCLLLEGKILNASKGEEKGCLIEIFETSGRKDTIVISGSKKSFRYKLEKNTYYGIRISKKGFIPRLISINTIICDQSELLYRFSFETSLLEESQRPSLNSDALDFPIAIIQYNEQDDSFNYSEQYTRYIKKEMSTIQPRVRTYKLESLTEICSSLKNQD